MFNDPSLKDALIQIAQQLVEGHIVHKPVHTEDQ